MRPLWLNGGRSRINCARRKLTCQSRFDLAASRFPASDAEDRDKAVKNRDLMAAKMTPEQIAEAQKLAGEWKPSNP
jgi:hypothetical protein